jgi:hypothetical protein
MFIRKLQLYPIKSWHLKSCHKGGMKFRQC